MKKNRTMKLAAILLVLTLITSCFVGGTFAKYLTINDGTDTARVAYWGFNETTTNTLEDFFTATNEEGILIGGDTLIAPGTTGTASFSFVTATEGQAPEVDYKVTIQAESTNGVSEALDKALTFTLNGQDCADWDDLLAAIEALAGDDAVNGVCSYEAGVLPDYLESGAEHTITWTWAFEDGDTSDVEDTALGNVAFDELEELDLTITVTVEQENNDTAVTP